MLPHSNPSWKRAQQARHTRKQARLAVEPLEDRCVPSAANFVPGEVLVAFEGDIAATFRGAGGNAALQAATQRVGSLGLGNPSVLFELPATSSHGSRLITHWQVPTNADVQATIARLSKLPGVAYVETNGVYSALEIDPAISSSVPAGWTFGTQEHLVQMGVANYGTDVASVQDDKAWEKNTGAGVIVAVLDTGVDLDHPDLTGNLVAAKDFVNKGRAATGQDDNGHGTHVAGIIAAQFNNLTEKAFQATSDDWFGGVVGAAPSAKIMPVKVLNSGGGGTADNIAKGIKYAADNGAHIINMSLGGGINSTIESAVEYAYGKGVLIISAAGNSGAQNSSYPAAYLHSLSIGAVNSSDVRAGFSNYGFTVDVAAPGVSILSTVIDINGSQSGQFTGGYGRISGTSMATPAAAGVAALIKSKNPTWTPAQVAAQLLATADNIDVLNPIYAGKLGGGRVNALSAVGDPASPRILAVSGIGPNAGTSDVLANGALIGVQFSHVMNASSVLNPLTYELWRTDAGNPHQVTLNMVSTSYGAFPGQGVQLSIGEELTEGTYELQVDGAEVSGGLTLAPYTRTFTIVPTPRALDPSFSTDGEVVTPLFVSSYWGPIGVVVQPDGKTVAASNTIVSPGKFSFVRYNTDGTLDTTFGAGGVVTTTVGKLYSAINNLALQMINDIPHIVAVGFGASKANGDMDFAVVRYKLDGTLDNTFGSTGIVLTNLGSSDDGAMAVAFDANNKLVVGGYTTPTSGNQDFALVRYNINGSLDTTFGTQGKVITSRPTNQAPKAIAIVGPDGGSNAGKIVMAGYDYTTSPSQMGVARYQANGSLDTSFGLGTGFGSGFLTLAPAGNDVFSTAVGLTVQGDSVVLTGLISGDSQQLVLMQLTGSGSLDIGFGSDATGIVFNPAMQLGIGIVKTADNHLLIAGRAQFPSSMAVVAYDQFGIADEGYFASGSIATAKFGGATSSGRGIAIAPDGKIVVVGYVSVPGQTYFSLGLARFLPASFSVSSVGGGSSAANYTQNISSASGSTVAAPPASPAVTAKDSFAEVPGKLLTTRAASTPTANLAAARKVNATSDPFAGELDAWLNVLADSANGEKQNE